MVNVLAPPPSVLQSASAGAGAVVPGAPRPSRPSRPTPGVVDQKKKKDLTLLGSGQSSNALSAGNALPAIASNTATNTAHTATPFTSTSTAGMNGTMSSYLE